MIYHHAACSDDRPDPCQVLACLVLDPAARDNVMYAPGMPPD